MFGMSSSKNNDYKIRDKICNEKIIVMGGEKMVVKLVEIEKKQNEARK